MDDDYYRVDPILKPYLDTFVSEARKRGVSIDPHANNLKLVFGKLNSGVAGITDSDYNLIVIDSSTSNWRNAKENTVWHELGHLYLHRGHDNSILENGDPKSIMNDGRNTPKFERVNTYKREYYINELFSSM